MIHGLFMPDRTGATFRLAGPPLRLCCPYIGGYMRYTQDPFCGMMPFMSPNLIERAMLYVVYT
jgi:hypothetical protein